MSERTFQIGQAISRFEQACRAHETIGAQHPEDHQDIQDEYDESLIYLTELIAEAINERMA